MEIRWFMKLPSRGWKEEWIRYNTFNMAAVCQVKPGTHLLSNFCMKITEELERIHKLAKIDDITNKKLRQLIHENLHYITLFVKMLCKTYVWKWSSSVHYPASIFSQKIVNYYNNTCYNMVDFVNTKDIFSPILPLVSFPLYTPEQFITFTCF